MVHDNLGAVGDQHVGNVLGLLRVVVASDVGDGPDSGTNSAQSSGLAVLDGDALAWLDTDDLASVQVDGWVRLGGRSRKRGRGGEDVVLGEVFGLVNLLDRGNDTTQSRRGDDRETVLLRLVKFVELLVATDAGLGLGLERGNDTVFLHLDVFFTLLVGQSEIEFLLEALDDAAEVLADEIDHELGAGVALIDALGFEDLVGELGTCFEGELFGEDEGVVAVEQDVGDLLGSTFFISLLPLLIVGLGGAEGQRGRTEEGNVPQASWMLFNEVN